MSNVSLAIYRLRMKAEMILWSKIRTGLRLVTTKISALSTREADAHACQLESYRLS